MKVEDFHTAWFWPFDGVSCGVVERDLRSLGCSSPQCLVMNDLWAVTVHVDEVELLERGYYLGRPYGEREAEVAELERIFDELEVTDV